MDLNRAKSIVFNAEIQAKNDYKIIEDISISNQNKVLEAFKLNKVSARHFNPSTGYGYDDAARITLNNVFKDVFCAEDAIVSPLISGGTGALSLSLFGILRPGDMLLSVTGKPYDTLCDVIKGKNIGSLADFKIDYKEIDLKENKFDLDKIEEYILKFQPKVVYIQRSRGYEWREALSIDQIEESVKLIKKASPESIILCDNCYGEFTDYKEPTEVGVDLVVGSLIKNPGGGLAPTGGYIAGRAPLIELIANRLTAPSVGKEVGSYAASYLPFFQGLFLAPSTVGYALKGNILASHVFNGLGYDTLPKPDVKPNDIITSIKFNSKEKLIKFCQSVQYASPVDSHVTAYPWMMPGYSHEVIMAAGTFIQGGSLELTADSPIKEPYIAYLQGGLTYEHIKLTLIKLLQELN